MTETNSESPIRASFVITLYNKARFIRGTVASALAAARPDTEIVIVEDGSSDESYAVAAELADRHPQVRLLRNPGKGTVAGTNFGIEQARGDYLLILDGDDICLPWRVALTMAVLDTFPQVGLVTGMVRHAHPDELAAEHDRCVAEAADARALSTRRLTPGVYFRDNPVSHSQVGYRREVWRKAGGYRPDHLTCLDYDFYLRTLPHGEHWQLDLPLAINTLDPGSIYRAASSDKYRQDFRACQKQAQALGGVGLVDWLAGEARYRWRFGLTAR